MAGITQTYTLSIKNNSNTTVASGIHGVTGDAEETFSVISPQSGNVTLPITVDVSTLVGFWIVSNKTVTLLENVSDLTVVLTADVPYWWYTGMGTNPFSVDIVTLKFTNAGLADATVTGGFLTT